MIPEVRYDEERNLIVIDLESTSFTMTEEEYRVFQNRLFEDGSMGFIRVHEKERRDAVIRYITEHPDCTGFDVERDLFNPDKHMGRMNLWMTLEELRNDNLVKYEETYVHDEISGRDVKAKKYRIA